jgi:hypothetical protein
LAVFVFQYFDFFSSADGFQDEKLIQFRRMSRGL